MQIENLFDAPSMVVVVGGTVLATLLRCGLGDCRQAMLALAAGFRRRFDAEAAKARLAGPLQDILRDGVVRARAVLTGDRELDAIVAALLATQSLGGFDEARRHHAARRLLAADRAVRTLAQASELAPVFGLAGTLISLSQLPDGGVARGAFAGAISMAVLTTLYGLLLANLLLAPLARMIDRRAQAEERERHALLDWLAAQVVPALPRHRIERALHHGPVAAAATDAADAA